MKQKKVLKEGIGSFGIAIVLAVLTVISFMLPFVEYVDKKATYHISGFNLLTGTDVFRSGEQNFIEPQIGTFVFALIGAGIVLIATIVFSAVYLQKSGEVSKKIYRFFGLMLMLGGILDIATSLIFLYKANKLLKVVRNPETSFGLYVLMFVGLVILGYGVSVLYRNKTLSALDFMVFPGFVYLIVNCYLPMFGIIVAFKDIDYAKGIFGSDWAGLSNFEFLFKSNDIFYVIRNTIGYNVAFIILGNITGIIVAICLNECFSKLLSRTSQTLILMPQLISWVIISYITYGFLATDAGWINNVLLGMDNRISFYSDRTWWAVILVIVYLWQGMGYRAIVYLSSIVGIDRSLYEAASIDGCGKLKQITKITIPLLKPTVITMCIMSVGRIMSSDFGLFYQTTQNSGALYRVTQTLDVYVYRAIMETQDLGMAGAATLFQSVIGFVLVMITNAIIRKFDERNALF